MHIDAFFDYLLGNEHPYWTQIPTDANPICGDGRDGVAGEDDMALRSLLPHIKPPRGRRKPEYDLNKSPSQRPRLASPNVLGDIAASHSHVSDPWTAHPDGQRPFLFPPTGEIRSSILPGSATVFPWPSELSQTPMTAYPQSAMTPINGRGFWGDEPHSAITPSKAKLLGRRHGAKAVSSAWRSGGTSSTGKTRGRPPNNRSVDTPMSATPDAGRGFQTSMFDKNAPQSAHPMSTTVTLFPDNPTSVVTSEPTAVQTPTSAGPNSSSRPGRPGRLSLQVPERQGGNVRLATPPPPVVMVNGQTAQGGNETNGPSTSRAGSSVVNQTPTASASTERSDSAVHQTIPSAIHRQSTIKPQDENMVNVREVESLFISALLIADWFDASGNEISPCDFNEAEAIARMTIGSMQRQALTTETFLINLAALAGGSVLQRGIKIAVTRTEDVPDCTKYTCQWGLRYGSLRGTYTLTETISHSSCKPDGQGRVDSVTHPNDAAAQHWKKKYEDLLRTVGDTHQ